MEETIKEKEDPPGKLAILISPYLKKLAKESEAIRRQFYPSEKENYCTDMAYSDPLLEDRFVKTKGLVHKYPNRVLIELTLSCASYCRFCTRRRMVSDLNKMVVTKKDIDNMVFYLINHQEINEVVISGGDPLMVPELLKYAVKKFETIKSLKIIRIHTRVPVSNPKLMSPDIYKTLKGIKKTVYLSVHFEHPDELTKITLKVIEKLHQTGAILLSQTVFLKGINDSYETLHQLFTRVSELGIRPYYIYRCDPVKGAEHFIVPLEKELEIMTKLRANLSGIAYPTYVIDTPDGSGKIPVPLLFWKFDKTNFSDFLGKTIKVDGK
jgi:lysine 2,3-aminomutase